MFVYTTDIIKTSNSKQLPFLYDRTETFSSLSPGCYCFSALNSKTAYFLIHNNSSLTHYRATSFHTVHEDEKKSFNTTRETGTCNVSVKLNSRPNHSGFRTHTVAY